VLQVLKKSQLGDKVFWHAISPFLVLKTVSHKTDPSIWSQNILSVFICVFIASRST